MTKKTKKILLIPFISITVITIAIAAFIKIYVTPDKVKAFLIPKAEKTLNRKISIGEVNISLFKGIEVKDFIIKEVDEKTDFVKCRDFVLKYKLLPLLYRKVIIDELKLVSPEIRIERNREGKFNFEDMGQKRKPEETKKEKQVVKPATSPFSLIISRLVIKDAGFSLIDQKKDIPDIKGTFNIEMGIKSADGSKLSSQGNMNLILDEILLKKTSKKYKDIAAELKYGVTINPELNSINIDKADLKVQEIPVSVTGEITNLKASPEINISLSMPKVKTAEVVNFFFSRAKDTVFGMLSFNLKLSSTGKSSGGIKRNLIADGDFNIKDGKIANNKMTENLSLFLGIDELKTIHLRQAEGTVRIKNEIIRLDSIFTSDDISMNPSGNIGLDETIDLAFDLKLSPRLTDRALKSPNIAAYIKDEEGWGRIPLKVSGTFTKPRYSVDVAKAGKRVIKKKAKELIEDLFEKNKDEQKPDIQKPIEDLFKGLLK